MTCGSKRADGVPCEDEEGHYGSHVWPDSRPVVPPQPCAQCAAYKTALNRIAAWTEGAKVTARFDEPNAARIARAALQVKERA